MKIIHWAVIFIFIIIPFSLVCRNIINNRFIALKDEVRINNAIDTATHDAVDFLIELAEINEGKRIDLNEAICNATIEQFFNTMCVNYNLPYNEESKYYLQSYIPAVIIVGYDGFYVYSAEETSSGVQHVLKPKVPYSYEDSYGNIINFTLDNHISIYMKDKGYTYSGELYEKNSETYIKDMAELKDFDVNNLPYLTDDLTVILQRLHDKTTVKFDESILLNGNPSQDYKYDSDGILIGEAGRFHKKRREVITNLLVAALEEEVSQHNSFAQLLGVDYTFNIPDISRDEWINAIDDISVISFIQGIPVGIDQYYNNYALGGSRITQGSYYYGGKDKHYHREGCPKITTGSSIDYNKIDNIFVNKQSAAMYGNGAYTWCTECKP